MSAQPAAPAVPPDHVTIEIDGQSMVVPKGSMIIQAADKAGIAIPRFCYHEKLPIAANCRMCMVEVEMGGKPMPKPQPACATPVIDGMKIHTQSAKALSAQRNVMEFLLINHPLDCPICDQGGECELQDLSMGYGRSVSRFVERKRVIADEDLGPLVATEMTRCIQCTRCVRFMAEVAGTYELGGMERGEKLQIGTYVGKPLMSELSGNVIDVCPVGALTNKPFRFRARAWELLARESIGYHDALGANLWLHTRRGEVLRTVPRDNEAINECWLSDRDRYACEGLRAPDRATKPLVKRNGTWVDVDWSEAIRVASEALRAAPKGELGALLHPATSNEEGHLLSKLVRALGSEHIDHRLRQLDLSGEASPLAFQMPLAEIEKADVIVLVGCNPRHEMPLLGARIRKAAKRGAKIYAINPLDFDFDFEFALSGKRIVAPDGFLDALLGAARAAGPDAAEHGEFERGLAGALSAASAAVILVGESAQMHPQAAQLRATARYLARATQSACNELPLGANALGLARIGALPGEGALDAQAMLAQPRRTYLLYGCEPPEDFADGAATLAALGQAAQVVAFASYASEALKRVASVILPIALLPEIDATLVNVDGVAQSVARCGETARRRTTGLARPARARFGAGAGGLRFHPDRRVARRDGRDGAAVGGRAPVGAAAGPARGRLCQRPPGRLARGTRGRRTGPGGRRRWHQAAAAHRDHRDLPRRRGPAPVGRAAGASARASGLRGAASRRRRRARPGPRHASKNRRCRAAGRGVSARAARRGVARGRAHGQRQPAGVWRGPRHHEGVNDDMNSIFAAFDWFITTFPTLSMALGLFLFPLLPLIIGVAMYVYWERKVIGWMHVRMGPNQVGPLGLLQTFADVFKLLFKEVIYPTNANRKLFLLAPLWALVPAFAAWAVVPFASHKAWSDANAGLLFLLAMTSMGVYGIILAGWASNSRYAMLGAMRSAAQIISYEIAMGFALVSVLILAGSLNLSDIVNAQAGNKGLFEWFWLPLLPMFVIYFVSGVAETNRLPFDMAEGESEIVAGFHVEYSGAPFAVFFLTEYANMILISFLAPVLFLGGWLSPFPVSWGFLGAPGWWWLVAKAFFFATAFIWLRATFPRYRYDQIMRLGWKVFIPITIVWVFVAGCLKYFGWVTTGA